MNKNIQISNNLRMLNNLLDNKLYIVGGYVRNALLDNYDTDIDIASALTMEQIKKAVAPKGFAVFPKSTKMGTCSIKKDGEEYEHTTFRKESYTNGHHQPDTVVFTDKLKEDASRRDFTVNSIYYDIHNDKIIDKYNGIQDIEEKLIRCIETPEYVFKSDGLRILRMVRLASELDFQIEDNTFLTAKNCIHLLQDISGERKYHELEKMLVSQSKYAFSPQNGHIQAINMLNMLGCWNYLVDLDVRIMTPANTKNIIHFFAIQYRHFKQYSYREYATRVFGKKGLNASNSNQKTLIALLHCYYDNLDIWSNVVSLYQDYSVISTILKECDSKKLGQIEALFNNAIERKTPMSLKDLHLNANDLLDMGIQKEKLSHYLNLLWKICIKKPEFNKRRILKKIINKKERAC